MCGLIGFISKNPEGFESVAKRMCSKIQHRGPDSEGIWWSPSSPVILGHRRLSIVDLSPAGHQPMQSSCGRFVMAYNGEIYNHLQLRKQLENEGISPRWRGHSDTETLLACFSGWGVQKTLTSVVGMFAFALWDLRDSVLTLARDRLGEKPLYWGWQGHTLMFASELKALKEHPDFIGEIDRNSLALMLRHCYIPAPYSIYKGIGKLLPGHYISLPVNAPDDVLRSTEPDCYWDINTVVQHGLSVPFEGSAEQAVDALEERLKASISDQMLADVPLGAFLSGGVDSSSIVALMQSQTSRPVKTFTIGFNDGGYNEAVCAKLVAKHLGTDHTELYLKPEDALDVIPLLPHMYCEPFSDSSQIPTYLVSKMAKQHVTVALSGDGGDELFGGYNRYLAARKVWGPFQRLPKIARVAAVGALRSLSPASWDQVFNVAKPILPKRFQLSIPGEKARKLADVLALDNDHDFYRHLTSHWTDPSSVVIGSEEHDTVLTNSASWPSTDCIENFMMAMDARTYMSDDILAKVDRAAMAASLETRVPMLDHRVVEFAWKLPLSMKIRDGQGKWALRQVLYRYVPRNLIERPKMGFGIPLDSWLRGPLHDWADALLEESRLRREGYFRPEPIRKMWQEHLSGTGNWQYHLWNVLMFQAWLEVQ